MPKFFAERDNITNTHIIIDNEDVSHITKVLRLGIGSQIKVCDGRGMDYEAEIEQIESKRIVCRIIYSEKCNNEPNIEVVLFQGIPKASKMDYIIQKTTELGIAKIIPLILDRCVVKIEDKKNKKQEKWQKIANEAAKQCGRGVIPEVCMPLSLDEAIKYMEDLDLCFVPYECEEKQKLRDTLTKNENVKSVGFIIGPEGGFDGSEIDKIKQAGIETITLGKRILRTETAGEAVLAMVMYELGDINA